MTRQRLSLILVAVGLVLAVLLVSAATLPIPARAPIDAHGVAGELRSSQRFVVADGACVRVSWAVENVAAVYFDGTGTIGADERELCIDGAHALELEASDGTTFSVSVPVVVLVRTPLFWVGVVAAVVALISAGAVALVPTASGARMITVVGQSALLIGFGVGLTFLLLEGMTRLYITTAGSERDKLIYLGSAQDIIDANSWGIGMPYLNYTMLPNVNGMNAMGFRNPLYDVPKPPDTFRILTLGGSTTYGYNVEAEQAYPAQMEAALRDEYGYENVEVVNGGIPSYATMNSLVNLQTRGLEQDPDLVIVYHAINDMMLRWQTADCYRGMNALRGIGDEGTWSFETPTLSRWALVRYIGVSAGWLADPSDLQWRFRHTGLCNGTPDGGLLNHITAIEENPPVYFERNLRHMVAIANANDVPLLLVTQPMDYLGIDASAADGDTVWVSIQRGQPEHNAVTLDVAADTGALVYDFAAAYADVYDASDWMGDRTHLQPQGLVKQGAMFAAYLHENGLVSD